MVCVSWEIYDSSIFLIYSLFRSFFLSVIPDVSAVTLRSSHLSTLNSQIFRVGSPIPCADARTKIRSISQLLIELSIFKVSFGFPYKGETPPTKGSFARSFPLSLIGQALEGRRAHSLCATIKSFCIRIIANRIILNTVTYRWLRSWCRYMVWWKIFKIFLNCFYTKSIILNRLVTSILLFDLITN